MNRLNELSIQLTQKRKACVLTAPRALNDWPYISFNVYYYTTIIRLCSSRMCRLSFCNRVSTPLLSFVSIDRIENDVNMIAYTQWVLFHSLHLWLTKKRVSSIVFHLFLIDSDQFTVIFVFNCASHRSFTFNPCIECSVEQPAVGRLVHYQTIVQIPRAIHCSSICFHFWMKLNIKSFLRPNDCWCEWRWTSNFKHLLLDCQLHVSFF